MTIRRIYFAPPPYPDNAHAPPFGTSYFLEDGWDIAPMGEKSVRLTKDGKYWDVTGVAYEVVQHKARSLDKDDFERMMLPVEYRNLDLRKLDPSAKVPVRNYLDNCKSFVEQGLGFIIQGGPGVGKTSIAAALLTKARKVGKTALFCTITDLRELIKGRIMFDSHSSLMERCREVDVLVLDNLKASDANEHGLDREDLEGLIESRANWRRSTVITTSMSETELRSTYRNIVEVLRTSSPIFSVAGRNLREDQELGLLNKLQLDGEHVETSSSNKPAVVSDDRSARATKKRDR